MGQIEDNSERHVHWKGSGFDFLKVRVHRGSAQVDSGWLTCTDVDAYEDMIAAVDNNDRVDFEDAMGGAFGTPWTSLPDAQRLSFFNTWKTERA
jgi:hypothetical protein